MSSKVSLVLFLGLIGVANAQVPEQPGARRVHPGIANPAVGASLNGTGPYFQYEDSQWNHGEGFRGGTASDADYGGWFNEDSGLNLTGLDIHTDPQNPAAPTNSWSVIAWTDPLHPNSPAQLRRFYGYLRPNGLPLPTAHPVYGPVISHMAAYVDQGAFEMFCPIAPPDPTDKIVICILTRATAPFPSKPWGQLYRGYWSPDGLARQRNGTSTSVADFANNPNPIERDSLEFLAQWLTLPDVQQNYWPIAVYPVLSVGGREATLNEQRYMQVLQAAQLLLQENSFRNPLGAGNQLSVNDVVQRVVVVAAGGSNGCTQAMFATMRYPTRIHGFYGEDYNPSTQRLFGEHDVDNMIAYLSGAPNPSQVTNSDFLIWGKWASDQGLWIHDTSYSRRFLRARTFRPACFMVGDEDVTSTGDDWIRVMQGTSWSPVGEVTKSGQVLNHTFAWMSGENACHGTAAVPHPYVTGNPITYHPKDAIDGLVRRAIATRQSQLPNPGALPNWVAEDRTSAQQLRGPDDPHEWAWGRAGEPMPSATAGPIHRDDAWFDSVQPGAAGTWLGYKEAMLIRDQKLYVAGADGVVSCFQVANTPKQELVRIAQTHDANGRPRSLGTEAFALTALDTGGSWELIVGTRRHLYRLDKQTLAVLGGPVQLPWEVGRPHHMKAGDVLPNHPGKEIAFASTHGGLVFYSPSLAPIWEWYEPGIVDFLIQDGSVILLSRRGVAATVEFVWDGASSSHRPRLLHASRPIPRNLTQYVTTYDPGQDSPCQGEPSDIEWIRADWSVFGLGMQTFPVALWNGDDDSPAARLHPPTATAPLVANTGSGLSALDIATCASATTPPGGNETPIGDHLLMLLPNELRLYNQFGTQFGPALATKVLIATTQTGPGASAYYPFGNGPCAMVVGDLVTGGGSNPGPYPDEIVIGTTTGSLMWLHVNDLLTPGTTFPAPQPTGIPPVVQHGYWIHAANAGATATNVQPRTNQALSASWALTRRSGDSLLHVLDQRGAYWQVSHAGGVALWERDPLAVRARGWDDLGNRNASGDPIAVIAPVLAPTHLRFPFSTVINSQPVETLPWLPQLVQFAVYDPPSNHPFLANNWRADPNSTTTLFEGFIPHR
jgi:hypothetical protein